MNYARVKHYKATHSDGSHVLEPFNEAQAKDYGTILETDGIALDAAIRMVDNWNTQAIRQGNSVRYSIPFVSKKPQREALTQEAQFRVTLHCKRNINLELMASAIQTALRAATQADIAGTEYLDDTIVQDDGIKVKPAGVVTLAQSSGDTSPGA